jgi:hypothetical protein
VERGESIEAVTDRALDFTRHLLPLSKQVLPV